MTVSGSVTTEQTTSVTMDPIVPTIDVTSVPVPPEMTAPATVTAETTAPVTMTAPQSREMDTLHQQMQLMQEQVQAIQDVVMEMAVAAREPSWTAAAGSATAGPDMRPAPTLVELDTDRDAVGEEVLPSHMQSYASVPLGSLLDPKIKAKNWAKQYVDLELLVGETTYKTTFMLDPATSKTFVNVKDQATQKMSTIDQWSDAFVVFIAVYTQQHPSETAAILKYLQIICTMASNSRNQVFLAYDQDFRKLRVFNLMPWYHLHTEMFFALSRKAIGNTSPQSSRENRLP